MTTRQETRSPPPPKPLPIRDIIYGLIGAFVSAVAITTWNDGRQAAKVLDRLDQAHMRVDLDQLDRDVLSLEQIHDREWPQEIDRLTLMNQTLKDQVAALQMRVEALEK